MKKNNGVVVIKDPKLAEGLSKHHMCFGSKQYIKKINNEKLVQQTIKPC
jgi:hypothetical protein